MKALRHCELIDSVVVRVRSIPQGEGKPALRVVDRHCEGAQSVFGPSRAETIAKTLGPGWEVWPMDRFREF
jgi:hypothetical protein